MPDVHPQFPHVDAAQLVAEDVNGTASRVGGCSEQAQKRALARAVRAEEDPVLSGFDRNVDVFQQVSAVADEIHVFGRQNCAGGVLHEN